ncbi:hypothetical protein pipiens_000730, partial [Culex pipiens pipiens]
MFLVMEFLDPAMGTTMYSTAFLLGLELVAAEMRVTGNNIISCLYALGEAVLGLHWQCTPATGDYCWKVAYIPGLISVPPGLLLRVVNCSFCWLTNTLVYYGLSLNSVTLAGDKYLNFILVALIELPGYVILQMILDRIGRRITLCSSMLLCGLFCFLSEFVPAENHWTNLGMFLVSKLAITMSFCTLYIYTAEIFPTNLRQSLMAICSMFGRFGSMIAPQTPLLAKLWLPLPMVVFGTMGIASGLTILQFPETLNTQLPNTVEEAMSMNSEGNKDYRKVRTK